MSQGAHVLSVQAIEDLRAALLRFQGAAQEALRAAAQEVQRTLEWLAERLRYWQGEVRRREEILRQAQQALARCQLPVRDREGRSYMPPCPREQETVSKAQVYLAQAQDEVRTVQGWTKLVQQAAADYEREARRLGGLLASDVPNATALLRTVADRLDSYLATRLPAAGTGTPVGALDQIGMAVQAVLGVGGLGGSAPLGGASGAPESGGRPEGEPRRESIAGG